MSVLLNNNRRESRHMRIEGAPLTYTEERFSIFFSQFGRIQKVSIKENGQVIVSFMDVRSAQKAYSANPKIDGRHLKLFFHEPGSSNVVHGSTLKENEQENNEILNLKRSLPALPSFSVSKIERKMSLSDKKEKRRNCTFDRNENIESLEKFHTSTSGTKKNYEKNVEQLKNDDYLKICNTQTCSYNSRRNEEQAKQANGGLLGILVKKLSFSYNNEKLQEYFKKIVKKHANLIDIQFNNEYSSNNAIILLQKVIDINSLLNELNQNDNNKPQIEAILADSATVTEAHNNYLAATTAVASGIGLSKPSLNTKEDNLMSKNFIKNKEKKNICTSENQSGSEFIATTTSTTTIISASVASKSLVSSSIYGISPVNADPFHKNASRTLYVGNLERRVTDESLKERFDIFGHILDIDVKNRDTAPFAFIQYTNINSVVSAIKACNPNKSSNSDKSVTSITNLLKPLKTNWGKSICSNKLWIGALPLSCNEQYLVSKMKVIAPDDIIEVIYDAKYHEAIVVFKFTESAQIACNKIKNKILTFPPEKQHKGNSLHVHVDFCSEKLHDFFVDRKFGQFNDTDCAVIAIENNENSTHEINLLCDKTKSSSIKNLTTIVPSPPLSAADVAAAAMAAAEKIKKMSASVDSLCLKTSKASDNSLLLNPPPDPPKNLRTNDITNRHNHLSPSQNNNENNNVIPPDPAMSSSDKMRHNFTGMSTSNRKSMPDLSSKSSRSSYNYQKNEKSSTTRDKDCERRSSSRTYNSFNSVKRRNDYGENHNTFSKNYNHSSSHHNFENYQLINARNRRENSFLSSSSTSLSSEASGSIENSSVSFDSDHEKRYKHYGDRNKNISKHSWQRSKKGKHFVKNYSQFEKRDLSNSNFLSPNENSKRIFDISSSSISSGHHEKKSHDRNRTLEKKEISKNRRNSTDDFYDKNLRKSTSPLCLPLSTPTFKKSNNSIDDTCYYKKTQNLRVRNCSSSSTSSLLSNTSHLSERNALKLQENEQKDVFVNKVVIDSIETKETSKKNVFNNKNFKPFFSEISINVTSISKTTNNTTITKSTLTTSANLTTNITEKNTTIFSTTNSQPRTSLEMRLFDLYGGRNNMGTIVAKSLSAASQKSTGLDTNESETKNFVVLQRANYSDDNSNQNFVNNNNDETKKNASQHSTTSEKNSKKTLSHRLVKVFTTIPLNADAHTLFIEGLVDPRIKKCLNKNVNNLKDLYLMLPKFSINYFSKLEKKESLLSKCIKNNLQEKTQILSQYQQRPLIDSLNNAVTSNDDENVNVLVLHDNNKQLNNENSGLLKSKNFFNVKTVSNNNYNLTINNENVLCKLETQKQSNLSADEICNLEKNKNLKHESKNKLVNNLFQAFCSLQTTNKTASMAQRLADLKTKLNEAQECINQIKTEVSFPTCRSLNIKEELERLQAKQNKTDEFAGITTNENLILKTNYNRITTKKNSQNSVSSYVNSTITPSTFVLTLSTNLNTTTTTALTNDSIKPIALLNDSTQKVENDNRKLLKKVLISKKDNKEIERWKTLQSQKHKIVSKSLNNEIKTQPIIAYNTYKVKLDSNSTNAMEQTLSNDILKIESTNLANLKSETDNVFTSNVATTKNDLFNISILQPKNCISHISYKDNKNRQILDDLFRQQANDTKRISSSNVKEDRRKADLTTLGISNAKNNSNSSISQLVSETNVKTKIRAEKKDTKEQSKKVEDINSQKNQILQFNDLTCKSKITEQDNKNFLNKTSNLFTKEKSVVKDEKQLHISIQKINSSTNLSKTSKEKKETVFKVSNEMEIIDFKKEEKKKNLLALNKDLLKHNKNKKENQKSKLQIDSKKDKTKKKKEKHKKQKTIYTSSNSSNDESDFDNGNVSLSDFGLKGIDLEEQRRLMEEIKSGTYSMSMYDRVKRRSSALKPCEEKKKTEALEKLKQKSKKRFSRVKLSLSSDSNSSDNETIQSSKKLKNLKQDVDSDDNLNKPSTSFQHENLQKNLSQSKCILDEKLYKLKKTDKKTLSDKETKSNKSYNSSDKSSNNNSDIDLYKQKKSNNDINEEKCYKKNQMLKENKKNDIKEHLAFEKKKQTEINFRKVSESITNEKSIKNKKLTKKIEKIHNKDLKKTTLTKTSSCSSTVQSNSEESSDEISKNSRSNATSTDGESYVKNLRKELSKCHSGTGSDSDVSLWKKKEQLQNFTKDFDKIELKNNKNLNISTQNYFSKKIQQISMDDVFDNDSMEDENLSTTNLDALKKESFFSQFKKSKNIKSEKLELNSLKNTFVNKENVDSNKNTFIEESLSDKDLKTNNKETKLLKESAKRKCNFNEKDDKKCSFKFVKKQKIEHKTETPSKSKKRVAANYEDLNNLKKIKKNEELIIEINSENENIKNKHDEKLELKILSIENTISNEKDKKLLDSLNTSTQNTDKNEIDQQKTKESIGDFTSNLNFFEKNDVDNKEKHTDSKLVNKLKDNCFEEDILVKELTDIKTNTIKSSFLNTSESSSSSSDEEENKCSSSQFFNAASIESRQRQQLRQKQKEMKQKTLISEFSKFQTNSDVKKCENILLSQKDNLKKFSEKNDSDMLMLNSDAEKESSLLSNKKSTLKNSLNLNDLEKNNQNVFYELTNNAANSSFEIIDCGTVRIPSKDYLKDKEMNYEEDDEAIEAELLRKMREEEEAAVLNLTDFGCFESSTFNSSVTEKVITRLEDSKLDIQLQNVEKQKEDKLVNEKKSVELSIEKTYNQMEADDAVSSITAIAFELLEEEEKKKAELEKTKKVNELIQNFEMSNFKNNETTHFNLQNQTTEKKNELIELEQKTILDEIVNEQNSECHDNVGGGYMEIDAEHLLRQQKEEEKRAQERRRAEELARMEETVETVASAPINSLIIEPSFTKSEISIQQQSQQNNQYLQYQIPLQQKTSKSIVTTTASANLIYSVSNQPSFIQQQIGNFQHNRIHTSQNIEQQQAVVQRQQQISLQSNQSHQIIVDSQMQINNQPVSQQIQSNLMHSNLKKTVPIHDQNFVQRNVTNINNSYHFEQPQNFNQNVQISAGNISGIAMLPQCKSVNMINQIVGSNANYQRTQQNNQQSISIQNQQNSHHRYVQIHPQYNTSTFNNKNTNVKVQQSQQQNSMHLNYQQSVTLPINQQNYYPQQLQHANLSNSQQNQGFLSTEQSQENFLHQQLPSGISQQSQQNSQIMPTHIQQNKTPQQVSTYQQHQSTQLPNIVTQQQYSNVNQNRVSEKNLSITSSQQQSNTTIDITTPKLQTTATLSLTTTIISQQPTYYQQQVSQIQPQNFGSSQQQTNAYQQQIKQRLLQEQKKLDQEKTDEQQILQQRQQVEQQRLQQQHEQQRFQQQLDLQKLQQQQQIDQQELEKQKIEQKKFQQQVEHRKLQQQQKLEKQRLEQVEKVRLEQLQQQQKDQKSSLTTGLQFNTSHKQNQQQIQFNSNQQLQQKQNANQAEQQKFTSASSQFAHLLQQQNILQNFSREQISAMLGNSMPQIKTESFTEIKNSFAKNNQQEQLKISQNQNSYLKHQQLNQKNIYSQQITRPQSVMPPTQIEKQVQQQQNQSTQIQRPLSNLPAATSSINTSQQSSSTDFSTDQSAMNAQLLALYNRFNLINNPLMQQNAAAALYARSMTPNISLLTKNLTSTQQQPTSNALNEDSNFTNINSSTSLDLLRQHAAQQLQAIQQQAGRSSNAVSGDSTVQQQLKLQVSKNQNLTLEKQQKTLSELSATQTFQKHAVPFQQQKNSALNISQISQSQTVQRHAGNNYPVVWQGQLAMKTTETLVQLHRICGNDRFIEITNQELVTRLNNVNTIRITQRMRLEPSQLESLTKKMEKNENFVSLLCLPCGRNREIIESHTEKMRKNFIEYFTEKMAAGIVNQGPVSNPSCVAHVFPPSQFANIHLNKHAPDLLSTLEKHGSCYLFVVITYV